MSMQELLEAGGTVPGFPMQGNPVFRRRRPPPPSPPSLPPHHHHQKLTYLVFSKLNRQGVIPVLPSSRPSALCELIV